MLNFVVGLLKANSKAVAAAVAAFLVLQASRVGIELEADVVTQIVVPLISAVVVWLAPANKDVV